MSPLKPGPAVSGRHASPSKKPSAPTPSDLQLTMGEGLPEGWAMQVMRSGRTLFIDMRNQVTTLIDPRTGKPADVKVIIFHVMEIVVIYFNTTLSFTFPNT